MNSSKRFIAVYGLVSGFGLLAAALLIFLVDPFFHYHMPWFGMKPVVNNEVYQNPGLADHALYDSIIIGSSMTENFDAKWFDEAYDIRTLKLNYSGASAENLKIAVERAQNSLEGKVQYVFGCLDTDVLLKNPEETRYPLPHYLYDDVLYNDVYYLLNKDVLFQKIWNVWKLNKDKNVEPMNKAYMWYEEHIDEFSKENVLQGIPLPDKFFFVKQNEPLIPDETIKAVEKIKKFVMDYPDTKYKFFYSPYSMVHWYNSYRNGRFLTDVSILEYSIKELLECENVELYFPTNYEMITDLNSYKDTGHYDMEIQYQIFKEMRDGDNRLTKDNYQDYMEDFKTMVMECDFSKVIQ